MAISCKIWLAPCSAESPHLAAFLGRAGGTEEGGRLRELGSCSFEVGAVSAAPSGSLRLIWGASRRPVFSCLGHCSLHVCVHAHMYACVSCFSVGAVGGQSK